MGLHLVSTEDQNFMRENLFSTIHIISGTPPEWDEDQVADEFDDDLYESPWSTARDKLLCDLDNAVANSRTVEAAIIRQKIAAGDKLAMIVQQEKA